MHALLICVRSQAQLCSALCSATAAARLVLSAGAARDAESDRMRMYQSRTATRTAGWQPETETGVTGFVSIPKRNCPASRAAHRSRAVRRGPTDHISHCTIEGPANEIGKLLKARPTSASCAQVTAKPDACNTAAEPCYVYCAWSLRRVKPPASRSANQLTDSCPGDLLSPTARPRNLYQRVDCRGQRELAAGRDQARPRPRPPHCRDALREERK